jgi:hypothetical protein
VLKEKLEEAWQARWRATFVTPALKFTPEGLMLGAGTVVVAADRPTVRTGTKSS